MTTSLLLDAMRLIFIIVKYSILCYNISTIKDMEEITMLFTVYFYNYTTGITVCSTRNAKGPVSAERNFRGRARKAGLLHPGDLFQIIVLEGIQDLKGPGKIPPVEECRVAC